MQFELEQGCRFHRAGRVTFHIGKRPTSPVKRQFPEFACSAAIDIVNSSDPGRSLQDLGLIARGACSIRSHGCIMLLCLAQTGLYTVAPLLGTQQFGLGRRSNPVAFRNWPAPTFGRACGKGQ